MPDSADILQGGLTWKVLKQVFPVAPSLRREHWDLLAGIGIEEAQRNEDELFYGALLHKFRRDGGFIVDLDRRFLGSKKRRTGKKPSPIAPEGGCSRKYRTCSITTTFSTPRRTCSAKPPPSATCVT